MGSILGEWAKPAQLKAHCSSGVPHAPTVARGTWRLGCPYDSVNVTGDPGSNCFLRLGKAPQQNCVYLASLHLVDSLVFSKSDHQQLVCQFEVTGTGNPLLICTKMWIHTPPGWILRSLAQKCSRLLIEETPVILIWILNINKRNYFKHNLLKEVPQKLEAHKEVQIGPIWIFFLM